MNTYLIPVFNGEDIYIDHIIARNISEAKKRFMDDYLDDNDDVMADWDEFLSYMTDKYNYAIGAFYELSEF